MTCWRLLALLLFPLLIASAAVEMDEPRIAGRSLEEWVGSLAPNAAETAWEQIPWLSSYNAGLRVAGEQSRPMLLWLMNGHPLGCT